MSESPSAPAPPAPLGGGDFIRWVCTKNPFYAISAALVLWGLWISFGTETEELDTWLLMSGLAGYTLLLAATALVLVRYLKLWDDTRTVLLLVVLMFLATSVTFDHVLMIYPERGTACYLVGLGLAIGISEVLLRRIELRLPPLYRLPYYLILALFFLYPIGVRQVLEPGKPPDEEGLWGLFGFSTAAGLVFLTLLPAIRRGADYVKDNGSPWPWPLYPWSLYVILAIAVPGRAILLCWSLHSVAPAQYDRLVFGPYFLVPFGFALGILLLEMGLVLARQSVVRYALAVPVLMIGLSAIGHGPSDPLYRMLRILTVSMGSYRAFDEVRTEPDPVYAEFLGIYAERLGGDPLFVALVLSGCFYGYAALRRVAWATEGACAVLATVAWIGTGALHEGIAPLPEPWPLVVVGLLQVALAMARHNAWNWLFGLACFAGVAAAAMPLPDVLEAERPVLFVHLGVLIMLVLGATFSGPSGVALRRIGAFCVTVLALTAMQRWLRVPEEIPTVALILYPILLGVVLAAYGHRLRDSFIMVLATVICGYWLIKFGWAGYRGVRGLFKGFDYIVSGLGFFVVAVLVSLGKSGMLTRWIESRWGGVPWWLRTWANAVTGRPAVPHMEPSGDAKPKSQIPEQKNEK
jgi:hypothetical protein